MDRRKHPNAICFKDGLYDLEGFPPEHRSILEREFFSPIDSWAAEALEMLHRPVSEWTWDPRLRSAWTRLLLGFLHRSPDGIAKIKRELWELTVAFDPSLEEKYASLRGPDDPPDAVAYLKAMPASFFEAHSARLLQNLLNSERVGQTINNFEW